MQLVAFRQLLIRLKAAEVAARDDGVLAFGLSRIGQHDQSRFLVSVISPASNPQVCILHLFSVVIVDGELVSSGSRGTDHHQPPATNECSTAFAASNKIDNVNARASQFVKRVGPLFANGGCFAVLVSLFAVGQQAIKIDVGIDFGLVLAVVVERVDLVDFDNQLVDVFGK